MALRSSIATVLLILAPPVFSQKTTAPETISAHELVKQTVQNELNAIDNDHTYWMYLSQTRKNGAMVTEQVIQTPHGNLERVIARNGQPLSPEQQKQEDQKLQKFVSDTAAQQKQRKDLDADGNQSRKMLSMLPDALIYTYAGQQGDRTRLTFKPNPSFHPPSREAKVFAAMQGQMIIATKEHRLVEFSGHLMHSVKFGGGILGDLHAGGSFDVRQVEAGPGHWEISLLKVNIKGRALLFKTINEEQDERDSHFKRIPDDLTLAQADDMAKKQKSQSS